MVVPFNHRAKVFHIQPPSKGLRPPNPKWGVEKHFWQTLYVVFK